MASVRGRQGGDDSRAIDARRVLSTKRAVAMSAPVLPAETGGAAARP